MNLEFGQLALKLSKILAAESTMVLCVVALLVAGLYAVLRTWSSYERILPYARRLAQVSRKSGPEKVDEISALLGIGTSGIENIEEPRKSQLKNLRLRLGPKLDFVRFQYLAKIARARGLAGDVDSNWEALTFYNYVRTSDTIVRLGLLFTFAGIAGALYITVHSLDDATQIEAGVRALLQISANKFWISAFALLTALLVRVVGDFVAGRLSKHLDAFQTSSFEREELCSLALKLDIERTPTAQANTTPDVRALGLEIASQFNLALKAMTEAYDEGFRSVDVRIESSLTDALLKQQEAWHEVLRGYIDLIERNKLSAHPRGDLKTTPTQQQAIPAIAESAREVFSIGSWPAYSVSLSIYPPKIS